MSADISNKITTFCSYFYQLIKIYIDHCYNNGFITKNCLFSTLNI